MKMLDNLFVKFDFEFVNAQDFNTESGSGYDGKTWDSSQKSHRKEARFLGNHDKSLRYFILNELL
jgi:hypothetical protein